MKRVIERRTAAIATAIAAGLVALAWANRFVTETRSATVLTDELDPVDVWSEQINLVARADLHRYFGELGLRSY